MYQISRTRMTRSTVRLSQTHNHGVVIFSVIILILSTREFGECVSDIIDADKPIPVTHVDGVLAHAGKLPCDVRVPTRDDKIHMVLWYRDRDGEPIYRYDVRDKPHTEAKRWSGLGDRLYFQTMSDPAHLSIQDLRVDDDGVYRCRVDFRNSPTRNSRINLTVIVPSELPVIYDGNGIVASTVIGPYNEGSDLILTCEVSGGRPRPQVKWFLDQSMIDDSYQERNDGVLVNRLVYPIRRLHLNSKFVCQASNTNLTLPQSTPAILNLNLRPLTVSIPTKDANLLAEKRYDIECVSVGSRPPPQITWWKNSRQIRKMPITPHTDDNNITRSILSFIPTIEDDGKILTCRSENLWIPASAIEDRWRLDIMYPPKVTLSLGSNMVADDLKEGDDLYFECSVKSNPSYTRLSWFHEGRELRHNVSQGVVMSSTRLVLQKITRHSAGKYTCSALNSEGSSQSNVVLLRVKFVPTCKSDKEELIGASRHETVTVKCETISDPPSVQFHWTFNNSGVEIMHVPMSRFSFQGTTSSLNYTPVTELDFGTLACWSESEIGRQKKPCLFNIVPAGIPYPPRNCSVFNQTADSLSIACYPGFDGGLPQRFVLEVIDFNAKKIKLNASSKMPLFSLEGMEPSVLFRFLIYAVNSKGRSEPFILDGITFRGVAKYTVDSSTSRTDGELNPLFAILCGCTVVLIIFLAVSIIAIWKRSRRKKPHLDKRYKRNVNGEEANNGTFQGLPPDYPLTKLDNNTVEEIGNPDVVPNKNERSGGVRNFIRIHKTPPARRRKKDLVIEVKNNGETIALAPETQELDIQRNHTNHHAKILVSSHLPPRESRI